tara:strand:+ start:1654 stop:2436 length:783 start_codon:yes stop_codon:yes gene_type:complete
MASFTGNSIKDVYKDILHTSNNNTGISTSIKQITCGDGDTTALHLSSRNVKAQPSSDSTTNTVIYDADGNALLTVDSTNDLVKAGIGQHTVNTQYAYFGKNNTDATMSANTHYAIPFGVVTYDVGYISLGTGTNPATSFTNSTEAHELITKFWFIPDNITIDRVVWFSGADAATGDTLRCHLLSYDIDTGNGSTGGDLSNGTVLADGADITNAGYEQSYYQQMTIQSANVNAGKVILFAFRSDSVNSDYTITATIKYHLR